MTDLEQISERHLVADSGPPAAENRHPGSYRCFAWSALPTMARG